MEEALRRSGDVLTSLSLSHLTTHLSTDRADVLPAKEVVGMVEEGLVAQLLFVLSGQGKK